MTPRKRAISAGFWDAMLTEVGDFVFAASHNILPDTPGENIFTAYMTTAEKNLKI